MCMTNGGELAQPKHLELFALSELHVGQAQHRRRSRAGLHTSVAIMLVAPG
jgi:hypothetical protein